MFVNITFILRVLQFYGKRMKKNSGLGKYVKKFIVVGILFSLLSVSTPAAPAVIISSGNEFAQNLRFGFYSSQLAIDFPNVFFGFFAKAKRKSAPPTLNRIQIYPGSLTVQQGEQITFSAVGYDSEDAPLSGINFNWSFADTGRGYASRSMQEGKFDARIPGTFTVTVQGNGQQAQAVVTVTLNTAEARSQSNLTDLKEAQTKTISSREGSQNSPKNNETKSEKSERQDIETNSNLIGEGGWNDNNWEYSDNPGNLPGNPPGSPADGGAGNGNFQMSAPVISLPGRGIDLALNLKYNSRVWSKNDNQMTFDIDGGFPAPGWSLGFGKIMDMGNGGGSMLIDADGTRHGYGGTLLGYNNTYYGFKGYTTDGKFIDYYSSRNPQTGIYSATAHFPNGTYILYGAKGGNAVYPTFIRDANGNYISITYKNNVGPAIETITDTLGRVITFEYDSLGRFISAKAPRMQDEDPIYGSAKSRTLIRVEYKPLTLNYSFGSGITPVAGNGTPYVIDAIYYPGTNTGYWFGDTDSYSTYGMISKVVEQRGMNWTETSEAQGDITAGQMTKQAVYNYPLTPINETGRTNGVGLTDAPTYTKLTESWDGMDVNEPAVTQYAFNDYTFYIDSQGTHPARLVTVTQPNGVISKQYSYRTPGAWMDGLVFVDETIVMNGSTPTVVGRSHVGWEQGHYRSPRPFDSHIYDERGHKVSTLYNYTGGLFNQVTRSCDYDNNNTLLRCAVAQYDNNSPYTGSFNSSGEWQGGRHIFNLLTASGIENPDGTKASWTQYEYDNYQAQPLANTPDVVQHDHTYNPYTTELEDGSCLGFDHPTCTYEGEVVWVGTAGGYDHVCSCSGGYEQVSIYDPNTEKRGNVTKVTTYSDAQNLTGAIYEAKGYDITGNTIKASTACCEHTTITYNDSNQYAYPVSQTRGAADVNSPHRVTTSAVYNLETGLVKQTTDANGRSSTMMYNPNTLRPVKSISSTGAYSVFGYDDTAMTITEEVKESNGDSASKSINYLNGLGLTKRAESLGVNDVILSIVEMKYTNYAEEWKKSLPYRTGETPQWSEKEYDLQGRLKKIIEPDGSETKTYYNETDRPSSASNLPGQMTRVADAWGRERWGRYDQQGRLAEVVEPNPDRTANPTGTIFTAGNLLTKYKYDTIGRLIETEQGDQIRKFKYDDLGRLTHQKLAEQSKTINDLGQFVGAGNSAANWSEAFWYDNRSNLVMKIDPRGVKTHLSYQINTADDPLNRIQAISYDLSGPTEANLTIHAAPSVTYEYMTTGDKSRIKKVRTAGLLTEDYTYDTESRVSEYKQTVDFRDNYPMTTSYLYDTLDRVTDVRYPAQYGLTGSPRKLIQNSFDTASRLTSLKVDNTEVAGNIVYNAADQTTSIKIGAAGTNQVTEEYTFDQQTGLLTNQKATKTGQTLLDLTYDYSRNNAVGSASGKTGHLTKIVNNLDNNKNREYEFDVLGRLTKAKGGVSGNLWAQNYTYDRYGNRTNVTATGVAADNSAMSSDGTPNLAYHSTSNRISTSGYEYDSAGNQTRAKAEDGNWLKFEYDAANRLSNVRKDDANGTYLQGFQYGSGNQRLFDYEHASALLKIIANDGAIEYTEFQGTIPTWTKTNIYLGDSQLSTVTPNGAGGETTEYNHPDRLGIKLVTNQQNGTSYEQVHLPFGKDLSGESSGATSKRFTNYERSQQTGLDYAINRTYDSKQGRFTQVDPIGMSAVSLDAPQTLNLYSYCGNDPINYTDPNGLFWGFLKKLFKWVIVAVAVIVAVMTIVAAPATFIGIMGAISAGAGAASQVLYALGYKKAGMILGLIAMITGFGSVIADKMGVGHFVEGASQNNLFGAWFGTFLGVGAVVNFLSDKFDGRRRRTRTKPAMDDLKKAQLIACASWAAAQAAAIAYCALTSSGDPGCIMAKEYAKYLRQLCWGVIKPGPNPPPKPPPTPPNPSDPGGGYGGEAAKSASNGGGTAAKASNKSSRTVNRKGRNTKRR